MPSEHVRAYIYRVLTAVSALAVVYGLIDADTVPVWLGLVAALTGNGLATLNTSRKA